MKRILLSNGEYAIVDDEDWLFLVGFNWYLNTGYVRSYIAGKRQFMHWIVAQRAGIDLTNQIDHINGNKLDNRRCNLRAATHSQNQRNSGRRLDNTSGRTGVHWCVHLQKWQARIQVDGKRVSLGVFNTKEQAVIARKIAVENHYGEFAYKGEQP